MKMRRRLKKKYKIIFSGSIFSIFALGLYLYFDSKKLILIYDKKVSVEVHDEINNLSNIKKIVNGKVTTKSKNIDTSKVGKKEVVFEVEDFFKRRKKYKYTVDVKDTSFRKKDAKSKEITDTKLNDVSDTQSDISDTKSNVVADTRLNKTTKGYDIVVRDGVTYIDGYIIVNKTYSLPANYGNGLTQEVTNSFNLMRDAAAKEGLNIYISSGFRSYNRQQTIYNNYVSRDGVGEADTYSARAGYSEHQSGLAFDVNTIDESFANTNEGKWLADNCFKYGFILRYPKGKTNETGYIYEPWHFRYVGEDLAYKLYNNGNWITIENFFGITSVYK